MEVLLNGSDGQVVVTQSLYAATMAIIGADRDVENILQQGFVDVTVDTTQSRPLDSPGRWSAYEAESGRGRSRKGVRDRPLLVLFASDDCGFSKELESEFATPTLAEALGGFECQKTKTHGTVRLPNGWRHSPKSHPQTFFFSADHALLDVILGWRPVDELEFELKRILAGRETIPSLGVALSTSPGDTRLRWLLTRKLSVFPRRALPHKLLLHYHGTRGDPTGLRLDRLWRTVMSVYKRRSREPRPWDYTQVLEFLQHEPNEHVLFEGWRILASSYLAAGQNSEARNALERALESCPPEWEGLMRGRLERVKRALQDETP